MARFCDMPKDWMDLPRYSLEYINGVISFLDFAYSEGEPEGLEIQCPCKRCCNINWYRRDAVFDHLVADGFVKGYRTWINHGEWTIPMVVDDNSNYGMKVAPPNDNEEDMTRLDVVGSKRELGATQNKGRKGEAATKRMKKSMPMVTTTQSKGKEADDASKGMKKHVPRVEAIDSQTTLKTTQSKGKQGEAATTEMKKPVHTKLDFSHLQSIFDAIRNRNNTMSAPLEEQQSIPTKQPENARKNPIIDSQRSLTATQSKGKQGEAATKKMKKPVHTKLDFSHLQSIFDAIRNMNNTMSAQLEKQQSTPTQQPENTRKNPMDATAAVKKIRGVQGEPPAQCLNNSEPAERDATELKRKLEAIQKRSNTVPTTNAGHEQSSTNSAAVIRNQGQQNSLEVTHERIQEKQDDPTFTGSEMD